MWWKKKKKPYNKALENCQFEINMAKSFGKPYVCIPIFSAHLEVIKNWCKVEGYECEADHMTENIMYYKISGWN